MNSLNENIPQSIIISSGLVNTDSDFKDNWGKIDVYTPELRCCWFRRFATYIWLIIMSKRKSKYGLNFKRVYCPVCSTEQPMIRVPKNQNQILFGGNTCSKCQAELDKYGDVIS